MRTIQFRRKMIFLIFSNFQILFTFLRMTSFCFKIVLQIIKSSSNKMFSKIVSWKASILSLLYLLCCAYTVDGRVAGKVGYNNNYYSGKWFTHQSIAMSLWNSRVLPVGLLAFRGFLAHIQMTCSFSREKLKLKLTK